MINLKKNKYNSLKGKFLVSSPYMIDERFKKTLIYIISDNESGSMGIIINKPALNVSIETIKKRILERKTIEKRADDNEDIVIKRFQTYEKSSEPVLNYYKQTKKP